MATHTGQQTKHIPFTELVTLHQQAVYGYLLRFTRDPHDAQDLFQETFLRAYRAYTGLQNTQDAHTQQDEQNEINYRAWLMRIAINLSKNYARDRQRRSRVLVATDQEEAESNAFPVGNETDVEETVIANETTQTLLTAIETLPFHQRAALVQRQFEGLDYHIIASNLECSQDSARAHVYQALRKLRLAVARRNADTQED
jgi:RNA polymerase sigma-70 factor (ECF subfamily)